MRDDALMKRLLFRVLISGLALAFSGCDASTGATVEPVESDALEDTSTADLGSEELGCVPQCQVRECGDDGCGGLCGTCQSGQSCGADGFCGSACVPQCTGRVCGDNGCNGYCGQCPQGWLCQVGQCCLPDCTGKLCGDNGCGGSCGECGVGEICAGDACCAPQCAGKQCGADGCGGSCGACSPTQSCDASGSCACKPNCLGKECGDDGCGGSCGTCTSGACNGGHCNCIPDCTGKSCGDDGCGGFCGFCWPECTCENSVCHGVIGSFQVPCNATVIDPVSGLTWELGTNLSVSFATATTYCNDLVLGGNSDWRLPNINELRTLIAGCPATVTGGSCPINASCSSSACITEACNGCPSGQGPNSSGLYLASGLETTLDTHYWSSTTLPLAENPAFVVEFNTGKIGTAVTSVTWKAVRCVR